MALWKAWWNVIWLLRPAFSRLRSFMWFATVAAGFAVRTELMGVTSIVRALKLHPRFYNNLLGSFHSMAVNLDQISALWTGVVLRLFPNPVRVNGRRVLVADGIKVAKSGKKMPGVKLLHQESDSNTKPEYIMGHSLQAVSLLVHAAKSVFAVPLAVRIHEGLIWSNRDRRTLLDKMLALLGILAIKEPFYLVVDAYYAAGKVALGLRAQNSHLLTRVRSNAVAFTQHVASPEKKRRGRPRVYGSKINLKTLFSCEELKQSAPSPVYGENGVILVYRTCDLLWRPLGQLVRFVAVTHPTRGSCILMCTDTTLSAIEIIHLYGLRFKIEHSFKQAVRQLGSFAYHFWMRDMVPLRRRNGDQYLHRQSLDYRNAIKRKMHAYHVFIQAGVVCQGLLHYLSVVFPDLVWKSFGSWLRTIRPGIPPSEWVVASALRQCLPEFLANFSESNILAKFIVERQDPQRYDLFRMSS